MIVPENHALLPKALLPRWWYPRTQSKVVAKKHPIP
jgi:hypothetical protein